MSESNVSVWEELCKLSWDAQSNADAETIGNAVARGRELEAENAELKMAIGVVARHAERDKLVHQAITLPANILAELESLRRIRDAAKNHTEMTQRCYCVAGFVCSTCGIAEALAAHEARFGEGK